MEKVAKVEGPAPSDTAFTGFTAFPSPTPRKPPLGGVYRLFGRRIFSRNMLDSAPDFGKNELPRIDKLAASSTRGAHEQTRVE
jgi:hypothetical protein